MSLLTWFIMITKFFDQRRQRQMAIEAEREFWNSRTPIGMIFWVGALLGLVVGVSVQDTTLGTTVGNLGWEEVAFPKPVFAGDTIRAETTVVAIED